MPDLRNLAEVGAAFLRLGLVCFGGPVAHLGYFQREFVERRRWLDDAAYADLVALCQFLPGPASSQVAFALGMRRAGLPGALLASACFALPSAVLMILFAYGLASLGDVSFAGWLHGLKLAAVAVVALAVVRMSVSLCPDWPRRLLAAGAAAAVLVVPGALSQVCAIAACAALGLLARRDEASPGEPAGGLGRAHAWAGASLVLFGVLLVLLPVAARVSGDRTVAVVDSFYRAGSLVFGGGHVVLPLLRSEVVPRGWVSDSSFLAGYGAAQALPGPLFTFAGYLGTLTQAGPHAWTGGLLALFAIFLPGWLLVGGATPFWRLLRGKTWARGLLRGANAAVVGILLAALYRPLCTESVGNLRDACACIVAVVLLWRFRAPPWMVVALMACAGQWILR